VTTTPTHDASQDPVTRARGRRTARRADTAEKVTRCIAFRNQGMPWDEIARQVGYADGGTACKAVSRALAQRLVDQGVAADQLREQELAHLDELREATWAVMEATHLTVSHGRVVRDDSGEAILDDGPVLNAVDRLLRISERRARLLGIDAPAVVTGTMVNYTVDGVPPDALR
jgi:hypothetical protein